MFTFFMVAIMLTTVANVLVTMSSRPFVDCTAAARIFIGHRVPLRTWLAIVVAGMRHCLHVRQPAGQGGQPGGHAVALCVPYFGRRQLDDHAHAHAQGHDVDLMPAVLIGARVVLPHHAAAGLAVSGIRARSGAAVWAGLVPAGHSVCAGRSCAPRCSRRLKWHLLGLLEVIFGILLAWVGAGEVPGRMFWWVAALVIGALVAQ
jgi:hypothetical protein